MANEPKVPEVRDDDPEEVADKLSIATAMWSRGDRVDALTWLRRAAESASDAEADMRALELAKAASELASAIEAASQAAAPAPNPAPEPARPASAAPPGPPPKPSKAPPPKPSVAPPAKPAAAQPAAPGRAPAAASAMPKKPPGSKLPPLPPLRPLGSAPSAPKAPRLPSMITSATGAASASGTVSRDETPAPPEPTKPMPWDEQVRDDEPTKQIALVEEISPDLDETATREIAPMTSPAVPAEPMHQAPPSSRAPARELPLAVGVRVRVLVAADGVHIVPEGETNDGVSAVIVPLDANDDLRSLFQRRA